jgi:hypothetical protein
VNDPKRVHVSIDYGQFCICLASTADAPYPDWKQHHIDQGFAIRPGAVSFCTISDAISLDLEVIIGNGCGEVSPEATRAIQVPFEVPPGEIVYIVTVISNQEELALPEGSYILQVEQWDVGPCEFGQLRGRLLCCPGRGEAKILRADSGLTRTTDLILTADPV